ncbi:MAG: class I mannose-6-phosphate isomerase [Verrucomicrobia bacterium]|nr:class I mannose-6-phosphate isomerase [Verrucomicrobiota bacterium]
MLYPLTFHPIFKERVWGGRNLERLYRKPLPPDVPIGESWEISDRPNDVSVIANGPLRGKDLRWLMENHAQELLGSAKSQAGRFPLLVKILDAQEKLSLQVHPPASVTAQLGGPPRGIMSPSSAAAVLPSIPRGEPKTEMWYIADATPDAELFVGLNRGVTRAQFERRIRDGTVAECFHRLRVRTDDAMFLPSGRVHAIGAGNVIFEIQQNSDTTYRVFDWNRLGLDGKPRQLHIAQSLASINFNDFEPSLIQSQWTPMGDGQTRRLVDDPLFRIDALEIRSGNAMLLRKPGLRIIGLLKGRLIVGSDAHSVELLPGQVCLLPAGLKVAELQGGSDCTFLQVQVS